MNAATRSTLKALLRGVAWLLFGIAALTFWVGGLAISKFTKTEQILAEIEGIGLAVGCGLLGAWAKATGDDLGESG